jgi:peptide/nickel transport system substrate-binding protein
LTALFLGGCRPSAPADHVAHGTQLTIGVPESTVSGPRLGVGQFVDNLTLEGLTNLTSDGRAVPRLAESWKWVDDGRTLQIQLRPGVLFHDGTAFDGQSAAAVLKAAVAQPSNRALYPALNDIASIRADGARQIVLELSQSSALLPEELTIPLSKGEQKTGTGPYRVKSRGDFVLEAFNDYYQGKPAIDRIVVRPSNTLRTAWSSLLRGEVDAVSDVPADAVEFIRNDEVNVISFARWYQFLIAFNSSKGPFRTAAVRRALNLAIDRQGLVDRVLKGRGTPSVGPLWPHYWAFDNSISAFANDRSAAAALLDQAGYPLPKTAAVNQAPARFRFTCILPEKFTVWERIALEVQRSLYEVGVDMQIELLPVGEYNSRIQSGTFESAFIDMISGPTPGRAYVFWRSAAQFKGLYNVFGYEDLEVERQFDILHTSASEAAVRSVTRRLQRLFMEDPPALFLAWNERARAVRRNFEIPNEDGRDPFVILSRWVPMPATLRASVQ